MIMGVFPDKEILSLIKKGNIKSEKEFKKEQVQPSSLDLTLSSKGFCIPYSSIPSSKNLEEYFNDIKCYDLDVLKNGFLHKGKTYVFKLNESLNLPENIAGKANPKSSIGRTDIHVKLITENGKYFDNVAKGYKGQLWLEINPHSFDIKIKEGMSFNQLRIFDNNSKKLTLEELMFLHNKEGILFNRFGVKISSNNVENFFKDGEVDMSVDLGNEISGYVAKQNPSLIVDLSKRNHISKSYFDKIGNGDLIVNKDNFYILNSSEVINIPQGYCAEVVAVNTNSGEFRAHYAGFFDPGFRAQGVLELRNHGGDFLLKDGQKIASLNFYHLRENSENFYGKSLKSNYQGQSGPKLSKFFK